MDDKKELYQSIMEADSLKKITKMAGWKVIDKWLNEELEQCQDTLENEEIKDLADIQASRKLIKWIKDFRDLFVNVEIAAGESQAELDQLNKRKGE